MPDNIIAFPVPLEAQDRLIAKAVKAASDSAVDLASDLRVIPDGHPLAPLKHRAMTMAGELEQINRTYRKPRVA